MKTGQHVSHFHLHQPSIQEPGFSSPIAHPAAPAAVATPGAGPSLGSPAITSSAASGDLLQGGLPASLSGRLSLWHKSLCNLLAHAPYIEATNLLRLKSEKASNQKPGELDVKVSLKALCAKAGREFQALLANPSYDEGEVLKVMLRCLCHSLQFCGNGSQSSPRALKVPTGPNVPASVAEYLMGKVMSNAEALAADACRKSSQVRLVGVGRSGRPWLLGLSYLLLVGCSLLGRPRVHDSKT